MAFDWWILLAVPIVAVLFVPALLNHLVATLLRLLKREPLEHDLSARSVLTAVATFIGVWLAFGLHTLLLARAVAGDAPHPDLATAAMTGYALSVSLGMLTIVLPAGLGAREGLLTLILSTAIPAPAAAAVAIVSRFIVTLIDVVAALAGWLYARSHHLIGERRASEVDPVAPRAVEDVREHPSTALDRAERADVVLVTGQQHPIQAQLTGASEREGQGRGGVPPPAVRRSDAVADVPAPGPEQLGVDGVTHRDEPHDVVAVGEPVVVTVHVPVGERARGVRIEPDHLEQRLERPPVGAEPGDLPVSRAVARAVTEVSDAGEPRLVAVGRRDGRGSASHASNHVRTGLHPAVSAPSAPSAPSGQWSLRSSTKTGICRSVFTW